MAKRAKKPDPPVVIPVEFEDALRLALKAKPLKKKPAKKKATRVRPRVTK